MQAQAFAILIAIVLVVCIGFLVFGPHDWTAGKSNDEALRKADADESDPHAHSLVVLFDDRERKINNVVDGLIRAADEGSRVLTSPFNLMHGSHRLVEHIRSLGYAYTASSNNGKPYLRGGEEGYISMIADPRRRVFDDIQLNTPAPGGHVRVKVDDEFSQSYGTHSVGQNNPTWNNQYAHFGVRPGMVFSGKRSDIYPSVLFHNGPGDYYGHAHEFVSRNIERTYVDVDAIVTMAVITSEIIERFIEEEFVPTNIKAYRACGKFVVELLHPECSYVFSSTDAFDYSLDYSDVIENHTLIQTLLKKFPDAVNGAEVTVGSNKIIWHDLDLK